MTYTIRLFGLRQPPVMRRNHPVDRRCDPIVRSVSRLTSTRQDTQAPSLESRTPRTSRTSNPRESEIADDSEDDPQNPIAGVEVGRRPVDT
jgi:hypothetical protein